MGCSGLAWLEASYENYAEEFSPYLRSFLLVPLGGRIGCISMFEVKACFNLQFKKFHSITETTIQQPLLLYNVRCGTSSFFEKDFGDSYSELPISKWILCPLLSLPPSLTSVFLPCRCSRFKLRRDEKLPWAPLPTSGSPTIYCLSGTMGSLLSLTLLSLIIWKMRW